VPKISCYGGIDDFIGLASDVTAEELTGDNIVRNLDRKT
jgi:hypothetical protein